MVDKEVTVHKELVEAARLVRLYEGSELSTHVIAMLDALYASYCIDLINVQPEGLVRVQSALKQVTYLRKVFANEGIDIPKI